MKIIEKVGATQKKRYAMVRFPFTSIQYCHVPNREWLVVPVYCERHSSTTDTKEDITIGNKSGKFYVNR